MQHGSSFPSGPSDPTANLPLSAWIAADQKRQPCFVVDLSADGARVHCAKPADIGTTVELSLPDQCLLRAEVVWRSGNRMGLRFAAAKNRLLI